MGNLFKLGMMLVALIFVGCSARDFVPIGVAGIIGYGASELSDGDGVATAASVVGSYVAADVIIDQMEEHEKSEYASGYEQARADAVKELYWSKVELDGAAALVGPEDKQAGNYPEPKKKYIVKQMPTITSDGRELEPHYVQIPIIE